MKRMIVIAIGLLLASCAESKMDQRTSSPNFKDGKFVNNSSVTPLTFWEILWAGLTSDIERAEWPEEVSVQRDEQPVAKVSGKETRITFINHATFLIQTEGLNILTDPVFSDRASPFSFIGPKRVHTPGIALESLPVIDVVIISHDHYDHLDLDTLSYLINRDNPKIYLGLSVGKWLEQTNNVVELDWNEKTEVTDNFSLWFLEVQHNSGRTLTDRNSTLWGGFMMQFGAKKIYFGGDSGYGQHYKNAFEEFGSVDIAFLPIGAYSPRDIFKAVHMDPYESVQAHIDLNAKLSIGMHHGTFQLTAESIEEPEKLLAQAKQKAKLTASEFITVQVGQPLIIPESKGE